MKHQLEVQSTQNQGKQEHYKDAYERNRSKQINCCMNLLQVDLKKEQQIIW